jgi:hypothetical protein
MRGGVERARLAAISTSMKRSSDSNSFRFRRRGGGGCDDTARMTAEERLQLAPAVQVENVPIVDVSAEVAGFENRSDGSPRPNARPAPGTRRRTRAPRRTAT